MYPLHQLDCELSWLWVSWFSCFSSGDCQVLTFYRIVFLPVTAKHLTYILLIVFLPVTAKHSSYSHFVVLFFFWWLPSTYLAYILLYCFSSGDCQALNSHFTVLFFFQGLPSTCILLYCFSSGDCQALTFYCIVFSSGDCQVLKLLTFYHIVFLPVTELTHILVYCFSYFFFLCCVMCCWSILSLKNRSSFLSCVWAVFLQAALFFVLWSRTYFIFFIYIVF